MLLDPAVGALLSGCYALLFVSAALHKLRSLPRFAAVLEAYDLLPSGGGRLAVLVPLLELGLALGLLADQWRAAAALAAAALLACYAAAIGINLARGRTDLTCGCGGPSERRPIAPWMVWRNLALAALVCAGALPLSPRALAATDFLTIAAGVAVAALLYVSLDGLLGQVAPRGRLMRGAR
jgi:hypothetical protein